MTVVTIFKICASEQKGVAESEHFCRSLENKPCLGSNQLKTSEIVQEIQDKV